MTSKGSRLIYGRSIFCIGILAGFSDALQLAYRTRTLLRTRFKKAINKSIAQAYAQGLE